MASATVGDLGRNMAGGADGADIRASSRAWRARSYARLLLGRLSLTRNRRGLRAVAVACGSFLVIGIRAQPARRWALWSNARSKKRAQVGAEVVVGELVRRRVRGGTIVIVRDH